MVMPAHRESPVKALADLFAFLARVFSDPLVVETGEKFFEAIQTVAENMPELPTAQPALEGGDDGH